MIDVLNAKVVAPELTATVAPLFASTRPLAFRPLMVPPRVTVSAGGGVPPELLEPELPQAVSAPALARTANHRTKTDDDVKLTDIPLLKFSEHNNKRTAPWESPLSVVNDKLNCNCETTRTLGTTLVASEYATKSCASALRRASPWRGARAFRRTTG